MPYQGGHFYNFGRPNACIYNSSVWFPGGGGDFNDPIRNSITNAYLSLFGRYGEQAGVEGYVESWVYGTGQETYGTITEMVRAGGDRTIGGSGEWNDVNSFGRHTGMAAGTCPIRGCTDPSATNYNSSATVDDGSCTYAPPTVSLSASPTTIIQGNCVTLSWSASGVGLSSATLTDVSNPAYSGSATVCPSNTKTYSYTACGTGGCSTVVRTVTVYIPPVFTLTADDTEITAGLCTTLRWTTTGDANNLTWLSGGLSNLNLNSNSTVCPSDSTTYFGRVSGLGGEDSDDVTVTVHQIPTGSISVPETLLYGQQGIVEYQTQYANLSINLKIYFRNNVETTLAYDYDFPVASSTQLTAPDSSTIRNGDTNINVIYDDLGPRYIDYVFTFSGSGGSSTTTSTTTIIIDETPDNVILEETEGRFNSEEPVYTPNITPDEVIESDLYLIEGIDIPVELKSNKPIQVDINKSNNWQNIREM